jgi:hypothetical protein
LVYRLQSDLRMSALRRVVFFVLASSACLVSACRDCDCKTLELDLPNLVDNGAQTVVVELRHVATSPPLVTCTWRVSDTTIASRWICSPLPDDGNTPTLGMATESEIAFTMDDAQLPWLIAVTGPSGTQALQRTPIDNDSGEGWPTDRCSCTPYILRLTAPELQAVGAKTR